MTLEQALKNPKIDTVWYQYGYLNGRAKTFPKKYLTPEIIEESYFKGTDENLLIMAASPYPESAKND